MSLKKTLILALFLLGAVAYILQVQVPSDQEKAALGLPFGSLNNESIESIEIAGPLGQYTLKNPDPKPAAASAEPSVVEVDSLKKWELADVKGAEVDRSALNALISTLIGFKLEEPLPAQDLDPDVAVYGLKEPDLRVRVTSAGKTTELQFGKENSYVAKRYVRIDGANDIYLVPSGLYSAANKTKKEFRNKAPLEFLDNELKSISLHTPSTGTIKFEIDDHYQWHIVQPAAYTASSTALADLTREIRSMRAETFLDGDLKLSDYALDQPALRVDMEFKPSAKREPLQLSFSPTGAKGVEQAYLKVSDKATIFKVEGNPVLKIAQPLENFREKSLFKFATDQAVQLDFDLFQSAPLSIVRAGTDWLVNSKPGDVNFVRQLLESLAALQAEGFPNDNRDYGFANPRLKLVLRLVGPEPEKKVSERTLIVGDSADKAGKSESRYYASVDGTSEPFLISKDTLKDIYPREEVLVKRQVEPTATPQSTP